MKNLLLITGLLSILVLQGCNTTLATRDTDVSPEQTLANSGSSKLELIEPPQSTIPEMQIIREMYQSGCLIKQLELNPRQQNLRISCAQKQHSDGFATGTI